MRREQGGLRFTGNATNLFAVAIPQADSVAGGTGGAGGGVFTYRRFDPRGDWLPEEQGKGRPVTLTVWQEDLVAQYASGGMFYYGPSKVYRSPPAQPWRPLALASDDMTLLALGLTQQGRVVFSRSGAEDWGEVETVPIDMAPLEDSSPQAKIRAAERVSETARAAVAGGIFHVVWQSEVRDLSTGAAEPIWLLHHVWRDSEGQWSYTSMPDIQARRQIGLSAAQGRLIMVYMEGSPGLLRRAQFVPETARWHALDGQIDLSPVAGMAGQIGRAHV